MNNGTVILDAAGESLHATDQGIIPPNAVRGILNYYIHWIPEWIDDGISFSFLFCSPTYLLPISTFLLLLSPLLIVCYIYKFI